VSLLTGLSGREEQRIRLALMAKDAVVYAVLTIPRPHDHQDGGDSAWVVGEEP